MKILMVSPRYYPNIGGVELHIKEISERLAEDSHKVTVLCVDSSLKKIEENDVNGIKVIRCPGFSPKNNYHISKTLYKKIKELDYDIIHCHSYNSATTLLGVLANKGKGKCLVTFHSSGMGLWINNLLHLPYTILMRFSEKKVDKFICVSQFEKDRFSKKLRISLDKLVVVPNGLNFSEFKGLNKIKQDENLIISVGRLEKYKGFHNVINGFAKAYEKNKNLRLEIFGKGNYENNLRELIKDLGLEEVVKIGFLKREEMLKRLAKAGTFILLSEYEGQPISVLEAIALNKKVILNYRGVLREFVDEKNAIGVLNPEDSDEVKKKIFQKFKLKSDKVESWDEVTEMTKKVYEEVLG